MEDLKEQNGIAEKKFRGTTIITMQETRKLTAIHQHSYWVEKNNWDRVS